MSEGEAAGAAPRYRVRVACGSAFPGESGEVSGDRRLYESTRRPGWPANSFMVSVTDHGGVPRCVLSPLHVNST
ncbi:hypothetical protein DXZ75_31390 [Streptomyces sp. AcE210]|nr:hypothetical protein DXZ75_31390 [Streptomyces sp. AcE210]